MRKILSLILLSPWVLGVSGCPNAFEEMADKNSDDAFLYAAQMAIDNQEYTAAIQTIEKMTTEGQASKDGRLIKGVAYAGRCGLNLIELAEKLKDMGSTTVFTVLTRAFANVPTVSTRPEDCLAAEQSLLAIPTAEMTSDDWVFLAFLEFAKIGTYLARVADKNDDGNVDTAAPAFNSCSTISDADTRQLGTGLTIGILALARAGSALLGDVTSSISTVCTRIAAAAGSASVCTKTTASAFTAPEVLALRAMIKGNELGFGTCGGATGSSPACLCF